MQTPNLVKPISTEEPWRAELKELYEAFAGARAPRLRPSGPRGYNAEWIASQPLRGLDPDLINDFWLAEPTIASRRWNR